MGEDFVQELWWEIPPEDGQAFEHLGCPVMLRLLPLDFRFGDDMRRRIKKYKQKHRTSFGYIGESYVETLLSAHGEVLRSKKGHYDILFNSRFKVEVKSTQLGILRTGFNVRRVNHGWTLYADRHQELVKEENGFYALVLMIDKDILCVRFMEAAKASKHLNNCLDYTRKPRIRLGALYKALKPKDFLQLCEKLTRGADE